MTEAPVIETARLRLRPHRIEDFEPFAALFASDRSRFIGGPLPRRRVWHGFASDVGQWGLLGFGAWGLERKMDGAFIGQVGLNKPDHFPERELGWLLFRRFEGFGYAHEAALAARDFAYGDLGFDTLVSYIDPENDRSIRLAERLGATRDSDVLGPDPGDLVYRHPAPARLQ
ncbi:acetyltransferase, GNAT family [Rhodovulum sp. P5]|uniref:GNAT family N-acetyltransferase n=1 Tax=Rhodovulum sp. P5 TaxID=1564506 RepID=UPI0009C23392|nr:GNAT family N-acetyltransferase [Rhodovulum sp. P5]ARE41110.1 acetyltransferase, GNAT family [Rhodovulum sp. P5]